MSADPHLIEALIRSVEGEPDNAALRLHLADLLEQSERHEEALAHCQHLLAKAPDNAQALAIAAKAAAGTGQDQLADSYRRLAEALGWKASQQLIDSTAPSGPEFDLRPTTEEVPMRVREDGPADPLREEDLDFEWADITLKDVAGLEQVKRRIELAFLGPMRNEELRKAFGKQLRGGLLLYGPPGCGKTFIAKAVAGELMARFISISLTDVIDMYIGESERNLHEVFNQARRLQPCVLFIDEIDALGRKRSLMRDHAGRNIINQLLAELDGIDADNTGLYVLAATNHPWDIDSALRRPGRLDRTVLVMPPDPAAREVLFEMNLRDRPTTGIDTRWLAQHTDNWSGADIKHACESGAELAMENSVKSGKIEPISMREMKQAIKEIKPSIRPWMETARNYAVYANQDGTYSELADFLRSKKML